jgi:hypothetical protein
VFLLARSKLQAKILKDYIEGFLREPTLAPEVVRRTTDRIELRSGAVVEVIAADSRTLRGRTCVAILGDEAAYWRAQGESESSAEEVLAAAMPSMVSVPGGRAIAA